MCDQFFSASIRRQAADGLAERRVDAYLTAAPVSVLRLWSAAGFCMIEAATEPRSAPRADIALAAAFWLTDDGAARVKPFCATLLAKAGFEHRGQWFACAPEQGRALILRALEDARAPFVEDAAARERAWAIVKDMEARQRAQREKGELRGLASEYRAQRMRAEKRFPSWSAYMDDLLNRALTLHAAKEGRKLIVLK